MSNPSRRRILRGVAAAGTFALAGCLEAPSATAQRPGHGREETDLDVLFVRDDHCGTLFAVDGSSDEWTFEYLTHPVARNGLTFGATPEAERLRAFVDATDLESRSVLLFEGPVSECRRVGLLAVYRNPGRVFAELCFADREVEDCSPDEKDTVGIAVRLPFDGDITDVHGYERGADCDGQSVVATE